MSDFLVIVLILASVLWSVAMVIGIQNIGEHEDSDGEH